MDFKNSEVCLDRGIDGSYRASVCFNGEFYHARIIDPPNSNWNLSGLGKTEDEAINDLITRLNKVEKAA